MADKKRPADPASEPISKEAFDERDEALTDALDKLEKEIHPPKIEPEPIGGLF